MAIVVLTPKHKKTWAPADVEQRKSTVSTLPSTEADNSICIFLFDLSSKYTFSTNLYNFIQSINYVRLVLQPQRVEISTTEGYSLKSTSCSSSQQPCTPCVFPSAALPFLQPVVGSGQRHLRSADHQVLPLLLQPPAKFKLRCRRRCVKRCQIRLDQSCPSWSCVGWLATGREQSYGGAADWWGRGK